MVKSAAVGQASHACLSKTMGKIIPTNQKEQVGNHDRDKSRRLAVAEKKFTRCFRSRGKYHEVA